MICNIQLFMAIFMFSNLTPKISKMLKNINDYLSLYLSHDDRNKG